MSSVAMIILNALAVVGVIKKVIVVLMEKLLVQVKKVLDIPA